MHFSAFRQEAFTTSLASPRETSATGLGAHARAETVLIFSGALRAL